MSRIKNLIKNINHLTKYHLKTDNPININDYLDNLKYEIDSLPKKPKIKTIEETIEELIKYKKSICRFGDGEFQLMLGNNIPFQIASKKLSDKMQEVLSSNNDKIAIAIPRVLYSDLSNVIPISKNFWRLNGNNFRAIIEKYIDFQNQYYSAECTLAYIIYMKYDYELYFNKIMQIWQNADIVVIHGKCVFDNIENNIFNNAKTIDYIELNDNKNAFNDYDKLLDSILHKNIDKNKLIIAILGPTATVLCYDLALLGYQSLDLGHIVKSYDYFMNNKKAKTMNELVDFFDD